jgi:hypothetical protein
MARSSFRKPALQFELSGFGPVSSVIAELSRPYGNSVERRLSRAALGAGLTESAKLIRRAAPKGSRIKASVGTRFKKNRRTGQHEAKAGLNVANKSGTAPHAHFFVLGTQRRKTRDGRNRGKVEANRFVRRAMAGGSSVITAMIRRVQKRFPAEVARARAKFSQAASGTFDGLIDAS